MPAAVSTRSPSALSRRSSSATGPSAARPASASTALPRLPMSLAYFHRITSGGTGTRNPARSRSAAIAPTVASLPEG